MIRPATSSPRRRSPTCASSIAAAASRPGAGNWLAVARLFERCAVLSGFENRAHPLPEPACPWNTATDRLLRWTVGIASRSERRAVVATAHAGGAHQRKSPPSGRAQQRALVGYGLVMALDGTGDSNSGALPADHHRDAGSRTASMRRRGTNMQLRNVAAVMVTAQLPPFAHARADHRRDGVVDGQCQVAARRNAVRRRCAVPTADLRDGAGQPRRRRRGAAVATASGGHQPTSVAALPAGAASQRADAARQGDTLQLDLNNANDLTPPARSRRRSTAGRGRAGASMRIGARVQPASRRRTRRLHGRYRELTLELRRRRPDRPQRPHRLGGDERGGDAVGVRGRTWQPGDHRHDAVGQPAGGLAQGRTGTPSRPTSRSARSPGCIVEMPAGTRRPTS